MLKRILLTLLVIIVVGGGLLVYWNYRTVQQARAEMPVMETATLETGTLSVSIGATGKVRASQSATLTWQTSGSVEKVVVQEGEVVKGGDMLAVLEQTSLPQTIILAEADLANARQALEDLTTQAETARVQAMQEIVTYEQAVKDAQYTLDNFTVPTGQENLDTVEALNLMKERLDQAREAFEVVKYLPENDSTRKNRKEALDTARSDYNSAVKRLEYEYDLEVAQANLDKALRDYEKWKDGPLGADVEAAEAKIAATEAALEQSRIDAPFNGTITQAIPQTGDQVAPNTAAFRIDNLESLLVDLSVSEIDIQQVKIGQPVVIHFDALRGKEYHGQVEKVAMVSAEDSKVVNYTVTVSLTDADPEVRPGMTAEVEIQTASKENVLLVPNQAIVAEDGQYLVYVMEPGQPMKPLEVSLGLASETNTELTGGELKAGDQVVLNPSGAVEDPLPRMMFGGPAAGPAGDVAPAGGGERP